MTKLIKFSTTTCGACKMVDGFLESNNIKVDTVLDPFENPEEAGKYDIGSIPVTILLDDEGNEIQRSIGFKPQELEEIISKL